MTDMTVPWIITVTRAHANGHFPMKRHIRHLASVPRGFAPILGQDAEPVKAAAERRFLTLLTVALGRSIAADPARQVEGVKRGILSPDFPIVPESLAPRGDKTNGSFVPISEAQRQCVIGKGGRDAVEEGFGRHVHLSSPQSRCDR
jgi:hypothetical protein